MELSRKAPGCRFWMRAVCQVCKGSRKAGQPSPRVRARRFWSVVVPVQPLGSSALPVGPREPSPGSLDGGGAGGYIAPGADADSTSGEAPGRRRLCVESDLTLPADPRPTPRPSVRPIKVLTVYGTRPEAIKMAPVVAALRRRAERFEVTACATGQHREMLDQVQELFDLRPDLDLRLMRPDQTLNGLAAATLAALEEVLARR